MAPWLAWLLPVPLATVAAIVYASWSSRSRGPEEAIDSVADYDRFRSAMSNPVTVPTTTTPASVPAPRAKTRVGQPAARR